MTALEDKERNLATNLKRLREERDMSQNEVATRLREQGLAYVRQTTISRIEKSEQPVRLTEAMALAELFETPIQHLLLPPDDMFRQMLVKRLYTEAKAYQHKAAVQDLPRMLQAWRLLGTTLARLDPTDAADFKTARSFAAKSEDQLFAEIRAMAERNEKRGATQGDSDG